MKDYKFTLISTIGLIGTYASYLIPQILSDNFTEREVILITFFASALFLTVFISSVFIKIYKFRYEIESLKNNQETLNLQIQILKDEKESLKQNIANIN